MSGDVFAKSLIYTQQFVRDAREFFARHDVPFGANEDLVLPGLADDAGVAVAVAAVVQEPGLVGSAARAGTGVDSTNRVC